MAAPFNIVLANGLAVTAPDGGVEGVLTLSPLNDKDPRQKFVANKGIYFSPAQNSGTNVLEIQLPQGKNEPEEGFSVEVAKKDPANIDNQIWKWEGGVLTTLANANLTLGFGGVSLVDKTSALGLASAPAASVSIQNGTGGPVYISYDTIPDGATQTIQVPKGKTLRAIDANGAVLNPTPVDIKGDQKIVLTRNLSLTVSNDTNVKVELKPTTSGPSTVFIEPGAKNVVITAPFGTIYNALDPTGAKLMFIDDVKGNPLDFVLVDEAIEIYHVVVPATNIFINSTPGTIYLSTTSQFFPPVEIKPKGQYSSTVAPGTVYQAKDTAGNAMTITSVSDASKSGATVTVNDSDDFYRITVTPPVPSYPIILQNNTPVAITVTVEGTNTVYTVKANSSSDSVTLKEGSVLTAVSSPPGTPVAPERKRVDASETVTYTSGLQLPDASKTAIQAWLPGKTFTLLYKATRDGFEATKFHYFSDNKGPTLVIITSVAGYRFGGYAPDNWALVGYGRDKATFIFTLNNPFNTAPTKSALTDNNAILPDPFYGAAFGAGNDIYVSRFPNTDDKSYTNFPVSFGPDTTGKKETLFTGAKVYRASEIEVYKVA